MNASNKLRLKRALPLVWAVLLCLANFACSEDSGHMAPAIREQDSLPLMHATGVNTLISDSGMMRYHMVAEEWDIYGQNTQQSTWKFRKGLLMQRLDDNMQTDLHVQADTAYFHKQSLWELRGNVIIHSNQDEVFLTEELFYDLHEHEMWNHCYMHIITPERELEGYNFRSNEEMTRYSINNSAGEFPMNDFESTDSITTL